MKNIIVAYDENRVIGRNNDLPWGGQLKDDMERFRHLTIGESVIMGRKTFDSLPDRMRPLPKRQNIIISLGMAASVGAEVVSSLDDAYSLAVHDEVNVIGGGQIYALALPTVDRIFATEIETSVEDGDTFFPVLPEEEWYVAESRRVASSERNKYAFSFVTYLRNHPSN